MCECVCKYLGRGAHTRTASQLYEAVEEAWINWAGPPDVVVANNERGFVAEHFAVKFGPCRAFAQAHGRMRTVAARKGGAKDPELAGLGSAPTRT